MSKPTEKHYVTFRSPGTFMSEDTTRPIGEWDTRVAIRLSHDIVERHGARPYGFRFTTMLESGDIPDGRGGSLKVLPKELKRSGFHFIGGEVLALADVERRFPEKRILISNMRGNGYERVCMGPTIGPANYSWCYTFDAGDSVVNADGDVVTGGT
jgi:hypothetical protein